MNSGTDISEDVLRRCTEMGFAAAGICRAHPTDYERELLDWLVAGKHGEMDYLWRNVELRIDPCALVPGAQSIIVVADRYSSSHARAGAGGNPQGAGLIARYARGDDYHVIMRKRLKKLSRELNEQFPDHIFRACVDTAPVLEREHAQRAGIGAVGKNTLLIQRGIGSYFLLGEIITTLRIAASRASDPDPCSTCTRCVDACPTQAITPWSVDASRCISYLTIEHRGLIDEQHHQAMGDWIFGCDICQDVCPHNHPTERSLPQMSVKNPAYAPRRDSLNLLEVLNWSEDDRRAAFIRSSMKRAKLDMMKRNAIIVAGNALLDRDDPALRARLGHIASDPDEHELVRATAQQTVARLRNSAASRRG
jgi:epoxyqueuosine reductase